MKINLLFQKIKGTDINGLADSYCKITLVPPLPNKVSSYKSESILHYFFSFDIIFSFKAKKMLKFSCKRWLSGYDTSLRLEYGILPTGKYM